MLDRTRYATVVVDPPWAAGGWYGGTAPNYYTSVHRDYAFATLTDAEIAALDVPARLAEDAFVFLWVVNSKIRAGFDILDGWGLRYMFTMTWRKPNGPRPVGYPAYNAEWVLVGRRGRPKFTTTKGFMACNAWDQARIDGAALPGAWGRQVRACEKPEGFYDLLRRVAPGPRLDMFARRRIDGFDAWGDEAPGA